MKPPGQPSSGPRRVPWARGPSPIGDMFWAALLVSPAGYKDLRAHSASVDGARTKRYQSPAECPLHRGRLDPDPKARSRIVDRPISENAAHSGSSAQPLDPGYQGTLPILAFTVVAG